jgi:hypothetical protein
MLGELFVALVYIIVMLFMNRQTSLNKIPDAKRLMRISFASHSNLNKYFIDVAEEIPESYNY